MGEPWQPAETAEEEARRREAYRRLADVVHQAGVPLERLSFLLRHLATNEAETRRLLAEEVYGIPDELLDDVVRLRLAESEGERDDRSSIEDEGA